MMELTNRESSRKGMYLYGIPVAIGLRRHEGRVESTPFQWSATLLITKSRNVFLSVMYRVTREREGLRPCIEKAGMIL